MFIGDKRGHFLFFFRNSFVFFTLLNYLNYMGKHIFGLNKLN